jgi:hypothetical protein
VPIKDREKKLAYQREWYARNRKKVIAKVWLRKKTLYAGRCIVCGGKTVGQSKGQAPSYCQRTTACISAARRPKAERMV